MSTTLFTIGHGLLAYEELVNLLRAAEVTVLVDVRTAPGSRRNPDAARARLEQRLPADGIEYRWDRRLGGWRKTGDDHQDTALRNRAFAGYAVHMRSAEFAEAIDELLATAAATPTAVMCAEQVWWRCHRRMIADFAVLARGFDVHHLMPEGRAQEHRLTDSARLRDDGLLVYDQGA
ncbi:MAG TPA: DUF488 domain-containing protein [Actinopolymorphaceae bacterium]